MPLADHEVRGDMVMIMMDDNAEPQDFTIAEYKDALGIPKLRSHIYIYIHPQIDQKPLHRVSLSL